MLRLKYVKINRGCVSLLHISTLNAESAVRSWDLFPPTKVDAQDLAIIFSAR